MPIHLLLWRHAEAEDGSPDLQRKLTAHGEQQAQQMAEWIKAHAPRPLRILVSPALRAQQTARALGQAFTTDPRLAPAASVEDLLDALKDDSDERTSSNGATLIVGHQPTLGQTAAFWLAGAPANWTIKKGAVWWLSSRTRHGETQTLIQAVISCALLTD